MRGVSIVALSFCHCIDKDDLLNGFHLDCCCDRLGRWATSASEEDGFTRGTSDGSFSPATYCFITRPRR